LDLNLSTFNLYLSSQYLYIAAYLCNLKSYILLKSKNHKIVMKNRFLFTGFFLISTLFSGISAQTSMIVKLGNATYKGTTLSIVNKITFPTGTMLVSKTDATNDSYLLADIARINFGLFSGINSVSENSVTIAVYPNPANSFICIKNLPDAASYNICIFNMDGRRLVLKHLSSNSEGINVSSLSKGIYLLNVNGCILKFCKQ